MTSHSLFNFAKSSSGLASSVSLQPSQQIQTCWPFTSIFFGAPIAPSISPPAGQPPPLPHIIS
ncbi:MAG: hypothetical protein O3C40_15930 [Planctomycetota bacterium]|nr:hypothetical protein [Planctomycetota bacterium]